MSRYPSTCRNGLQVGRGRDGKPVADPVISTPDQGYIALAAMMVQTAVLDGARDWLLTPEAKGWTDLISAASGVPLHHDFFLRRIAA